MTPPPNTRAARLFGGESTLIGMVHLAPLPGSPRWEGSMDEVLRRAVDDARALTEAGFDAVMVENFMDAPFYPGAVPPVTVAAMTRAVAAVLDAISCPVGVNVLRNDAGAALSIAAVTGAAFIRANVHTGAMWTDQGLLTGAAHETMRLRAALGAPVLVFADVHVKHATPPAGASLSDAAVDAWRRGLADALIVSGTGTGHVTPDEDVRTVSAALPGAPVLIGSGVTAESVAALPPGAAGAIVGTSIMRHGVAGSGIDPDRAAAFIRAARPST